MPTSYDEQDEPLFAIRRHGFTTSDTQNLKGTLFDVLEAFEALNSSKYLTG
jgi:hypothetical protein